MKNGSRTFAAAQVLLWLVSWELAAVSRCQATDAEYTSLDVTLVDKPASSVAEEAVASSSTDNSDDIVDAQNRIRSSVGSSDMQYVYWDNILEQAIQEWVKNGSYRDPIQVSWSNAKYPVLYGFLAVSNGYIDIVPILNSISQQPETNIVYQMVMKSDMGYFGCAQQSFPTYSAVACLFAYRSLIQEDGPFKTGDPCTECQSGSFWCYQNLCREDCSQTSWLSGCECKVDCGGCSSYFLFLNCSCFCPNGYDGFKCNEDDGCSDDWESGGATFVVIISVITIAAFVVALAIFLVACKRKYQMQRRTAALASSSNSATATSGPLSGPDWSKFGQPPPAYCTLPPNTQLGPDPLSHGGTASPVDAADEGVCVPPPPYDVADGARVAV